MRFTIQMTLLTSLVGAALLSGSCEGSPDHPMVANGPDPIMAWQVAGPYRAEDTSASELLDRVFLPEDEPDHPAVFWLDHYATNAQDPGRFDLRPGVGLTGKLDGFAELFQRILELLLALFLG